MILLDGHTSQGFWRLVYPPNRAPGEPCGFLPGDDVTASYDDACRLRPTWFNAEFRELHANRIGLLVPSQQARRKSLLHYTSVWSGPLPEGAFFDLGDGTFVSSPCFTFLQMARELSFYELIAYGDEICGTYSFDAREPNGIRQRSVPLVTAGQLENFVASAHGCRGRKAAMRALPHIVANSASPMETVDEMLLCLPYRHGGYGIRKPTMNQRIDLNERIAHLAGRRFCRADICWPECKLDIEHQGVRGHADADAFDSDRARINALVSTGFEVLELTHGQVADLRAFEEIALHVAKTLGKRLDKSKLGATRERLALRRALFAWNQRSGRPSSPAAR